MLLKEISNDNLEDYSKKLKIFPNLLTIYHSIDTQRRGLFPYAEHFVFEGKYKNESIYFVYRENIYVTSFLFIGSTATSIEFVEKLEEIYEELFNIFPKIKEVSSFLTIGAAFLTRTFNNWYGKYFGTEKSVEYPTYLYYMKEEQQLLTKKFIPSFSNEYYYDNNISDDDSLIINTTWRHAKKGDLEQTRYIFV